MSEIEKGIYNLIDQFPEGQGPYTENEVFISKLIEDFLEKNGISQYECDIGCMYENPSCEIFSFSCCWIENGKLNAILNQEISRY